MLASLGINEVAVFRKLRVAFFSTGDELYSTCGMKSVVLGTRRMSLRATFHAC